MLKTSYILLHRALLIKSRVIQGRETINYVDYSLIHRITAQTSKKKEESK